MVKFVGRIRKYSIDLKSNEVRNIDTGVITPIGGETLIEFDDFEIDRSTTQLVLTSGPLADRITMTSDPLGLLILANSALIIAPHFLRYKVDAGAGNDTINIAGDFYGIATDFGLEGGPMEIFTGAGNDAVNAKTFSRGDPVVPGRAIPNLYRIESGSDTITGSGLNDEFIVSDFDPADNKFDAEDGYDFLDLGSVIGLNQPGVKVNLASGLVTTPLGGGGTLATARNFEHARLTFGNDTFTGNGAANTVESAFGIDKIDGRGQPAGTLGDIVEIFTDGTASLGTGKAISNLAGNYDYTFENIEGFIGSPFDDVLIGDPLANYFEAFLGNDVMRGGLGVDVMEVSGSLQQYTIDYAAGTITDQFAGRDGQDTVSGIDVLITDNLNIGWDPAANTQFTADFDELLFRNIWGHFWDGGTGNDSFTLYVQPHYSTGAHEVNITAAGSRIIVQDVVNSGVIDAADMVFIDKFTVNTEGGADINAFGDFGLTDLDLNTITLNGDALANVFDASGITSAHRAVMSGEGGRDVLSGGAGRDVLDAGAGNDRLSGGDNADRLTGGLNSDRLAGGAGKDTQTGGLGSDFFEFDAVSESPDGLQRDRIADFNPGAAATRIDRIDLATIDANASAAGNQAFAFIGQDAFEAGFLLGKGQLRAVKSGTTTIVSGEVTGDRVADFQTTIANPIALANLTAIDFVL